MNEFIFLLSVLTSITACSHFNSLRSPISIEKMEELRIGESTQSEVLVKLGTPSRELDLSSLGNGSGAGIVMTFSDKSGTEHTSLLFDPQSKILKSIVWNVWETEPEHNLDIALGRYATKSWTVSPERMSNPHVAPARCYFFNSTKGVLITYNRNHDKVESISWETPTRAITAGPKTKNEKTKFCIGNKCGEFNSDRSIWQTEGCSLPPEFLSREK